MSERVRMVPRFRAVGRQSFTNLSLAWRDTSPHTNKLTSLQDTSHHRKQCPKMSENVRSDRTPCVGTSNLSPAGRDATPLISPPRGERHREGVIPTPHTKSYVLTNYLASQKAMSENVRKCLGITYPLNENSPYVPSAFTFDQSQSDALYVGKILLPIVGCSNWWTPLPYASLDRKPSTTRRALPSGLASLYCPHGTAQRDSQPLRRDCP